MGASQNSLRTYLQAYVEAIFADCKPLYTVASDWKRDKTRLQHEIWAHGSQVLTIELPTAGKSLDWALDQGQYTPMGGYLGSSLKGEVVPVFLRDLLIQVFDPASGMLRTDPPIEVICFLRQIYMGGKKLLLTSSKRRIYEQVVDFARTEASNRHPTLDWSSDAPLSSSCRLSPGYGRVSFMDLVQGVPSILNGETERPQPLVFEGMEAPISVLSTTRELRILESVCDRVFAALGDFSDEENLRPKHGPGAVSNLRRGTNKYSFPDWPSKLEGLYPYDYYATHDLCAGSDLGDPGSPRNREVPSKLIAVPKTQKAPRLIASEPHYHQWIQQLLKQQLESRMRRTPLVNCIDFNDQTFNGRDALTGSKNGSNVTIDLSSASDHLTCWLVERACRSNLTLLDRLHASRTRMVRNHVDKTTFGTIILKKFSTMGSTVIFPMQSFIYGCIAIASVVAGMPEREIGSAIEEASHRVRVFGDDIIVPKTAYGCTSRLLRDLGLKISETKTFSGFHFRESCGVDAFQGHDVTPAYLTHIALDASPTVLKSTLEVSNNFWRKGMWNTAKWLDSLYPDLDHLIPIVSVDSGRLGRTSFCGYSTDHLKSRWNKLLHREEVRAIDVYTPKRRTRGQARESLLQWFIESPPPDQKWSAGVDLIEVVTLRPGWQDKADYTALS